MQQTFLKLDDKMWCRPGASSGPADGTKLFETGGFIDITRYAEKDITPAVNTDWFNKDWPYIPGKPTEPGAYWLRFDARWSLAEVFEYQDVLWYRTVAQSHPAACWQCQNMNAYKPLPAAP